MLISAYGKDPKNTGRPRLSSVSGGAEYPLTAGPSSNRNVPSRAVLKALTLCHLSLVTFSGILEVAKRNGLGTLFYTYWVE